MATKKKTKKKPAKKKANKKAAKKKASKKKSHGMGDDGKVVLDPQDLAALNKTNLTLHNARMSLDLHEYKHRDVVRAYEDKRHKLQNEITRANSACAKVVEDINKKYDLDLSGYSYNDDTGLLKPNP